MPLGQHPSYIEGANSTLCFHPHHHLYPATGLEFSIMENEKDLLQQEVRHREILYVCIVSIGIQTVPIIIDPSSVGWRKALSESGTIIACFVVYLRVIWKSWQALATAVTERGLAREPLKLENIAIPALLNLPGAAGPLAPNDNNPILSSGMVVIGGHVRTCFPAYVPT